MSPSPRRVDLRLTIPAAEPYHAVAGELAGKFAEYSGADAGAARRLADAVVASIALIADGRASIDLQMSTEARELVVTAMSGPTTKRTTCPLPD
ncbi:MAG TPA: hypothetical protein VF921_12085 [Vicinamibacterales bacterium]